MGVCALNVEALKRQKAKVELVTGTRATRDARPSHSDHRESTAPPPPSPSHTIRWRGSHACTRDYLKKHQTTGAARRTAHSTLGSASPTRISLLLSESLPRDLQAVLAVDELARGADAAQQHLVEHALGTHLGLDGALDVPDVRVLGGHASPAEAGVEQ